MELLEIYFSEFFTTKQLDLIIVIYTALDESQGNY